MTTDEKLEAWNKLVHDFVGSHVNAWHYMKNANAGMKTTAVDVKNVHDELERLTNRWTELRTECQLR